LGLSFLVLAVVIAATALSYSLSSSAERQSTLAIDAYDLHGDLRQIAGALALPSDEQTPSVRADIVSAIAGGRHEVSEIRGAGTTSPTLERASDEAAGYLDDAAHQVASATTDAGGTQGRQFTSADAVGDLVDRAASAAEQASDRAGRDSRIGEIAVLLFVVLVIAGGLLWRSRQRRRSAVVAAQASALELFEAMIEQGSDLFFVTGDDDRTIYCSPSAARFFGMSQADVCAATLDMLIHPDDLDRAADAMATAHSSGAVGPFDVRVRHADGGWRTLEASGDDLSGSINLAAVAWHTRDATDRRSLEDQLARQALEDPLTGLANRALFGNRLSQALAKGHRSRHHFAVLMIDLDGFKTINDTMGHDAGDDAIREVGARIARSARPGDTIARLGGDEFAILLDEIDDETFADQVAERILELVRQPMTIGGRGVRVTASVGIAFANSAAATAESLLRDADTAMYAAKASGRDRWARFEPVMHARATEQLHLIQDLAQALERRELVVYYQPSIDLDSGAIEGVEALIRWNHPHLGLVGPERFIPLAEQNGLVVPIGRWVLETACTQAVEWRQTIPSQRSLTMAVNLSGHQLNHRSLVPDVRRIIDSTGVVPEDLVLEVTESVLMADVDLVIERLRALRALGIAIAIDDFGTGYSSLAYLRQLPIDILKIDKSFVGAASAGDPGGDAIMHAIMDLGAGLHLRTIAEGVESLNQAHHVKELGCDSAQGFLFAGPMPPEQIPDFISAAALETTSSV
jgi:diguanylate cyclase (GGDEF)-like protein/PAS domain S-box-containing protein